MNLVLDNRMQKLAEWLKGFGLFIFGVFWIPFSTVAVLIVGSFLLYCVLSMVAWMFGGYIRLMEFFFG